ncbi:MAG TPA: (Fe-S)-binding protein, partial [Methanomicrobiales archaeon]|nr:(Fe-S)-binding protein [Methanomicrobiales archaeon]
MESKSKRKSIKELSPIDIYRLLPKTNCQECGEANCMAFATRLINGEYTLQDCPPILKEENARLYADLAELLAPPVRAVTIGTGEHAVTVGGKHVLYRHDFTYHNPTPIAIDITDGMSDEDLVGRIKTMEEFAYSYIGRTLTLDALAVRSTSGDADTFGRTVERVSAL